MHHGHKYLDPQIERLTLCDGEGEKTFYEFLGALTEPKPDFSKVRGLTYYQERELITTEKQERIKYLDEIPFKRGSKIRPRPNAS